MKVTDYHHFTLANGLKVFFYPMPTCGMASMALLYNVGSRDEQPERTGFAHLFEHLMFGGSANIPVYDAPLQRVGGQNNAFTSSDYTLYYVSVPANNVETALWLESDRMLGLSFDPKVLDTQQKVVIEEYNQRYLTSPYGDAWLKILPLAYNTHPYRWPTIGADQAHILDASLDDVKSFFYRFYRPNNATLVIGGPFELAQIQDLINKWFGDIPRSDDYIRNLPIEPIQTKARLAETSAKVSLDSIYKVYKMEDYLSNDFMASVICGEILGSGNSSRLYDNLVNKTHLFDSVRLSLTGSLDPGLMVVEGKVAKGIPIEQAHQALEEQINLFLDQKIEDQELAKTINLYQIADLGQQIDGLNFLVDQALYCTYATPETAVLRMEYMQQLKTDEVLQAAKRIFKPEACSTLLYHAQN